MDISGAITDMITTWLQEAVDMFLKFIENIIFNYDGLAGTALEAYNLFVWASASLLVILCLVRVVKMLFSEAEGSQEANAWNIIVDTVKAGLILVLAPFIVSITMQLVRAFSEFFISDMEVSLKDSIDNMMGSDSFIEHLGSGTGNIISWLFVLVVIAFFVIKMFIVQAQILFNEIISPLVAVSIASEDFDFTQAWAKDLLSHAVTIVALVLTMALFVEALTAPMDIGFWAKVSAIMGTGALVIAGPTIIKSIRYSSGVGRASQSAGRMAIRMISRRR